MHERRKRPARLTVAALVLLAVCVVLAAWSYQLLAQAKNPLIRTAHDFAQSMIAGDLYVTAQTHLDEDLPLDVRRSELARIREAMENAGFDWQRALPLGFGGSMARVAGTAGEVNAAVGWLYLTDGDAVVGIELSARQRRGGFTITRIWKWQPIEGSIETHSLRAYEAFAREPAPDDLDADIRVPRYVFERF